MTTPPHIHPDILKPVSAESCTMNHFAKRWDHTLKIKHIFMGRGELPEASETVAMAAEVAKCVRSFVLGLGEDDHLRSDLDDCLDEFDLATVENAYEARDRLNGALEILYDAADAGKRVWIE